VNRVPVGVEGELWLAGVQVAAGYLRRPELTAERFVHHDGRRWYRTGDVVRHRVDGLLEYRGRADGQVKVRGHRVELGEVTAALRALAGIADAATVVRAGELVACVVSADGFAFDPAAIRHALRTTLPSYLVPGTLLAVEALPLLPNGKLNLTALNTIEVPIASTRIVEAPSGPAEELIAELWAPLLSVSSVGAEDNFFDLGGDSLSASRFIAQLRAMDIDLPLMTVFTHPTVRGLAGPLMEILLTDAGEENPSP
jgi:acyl-CoA synthetase (AMP-forming)/AMP-acid ligase II